MSKLIQLHSPDAEAESGLGTKLIFSQSFLSVAAADAAVDVVTEDVRRLVAGGFFDAEDDPRVALECGGTGVMDA